MNLSDGSLLEALLASPVGIAVLDRDLRFTRVNRALAGMNSAEPDDFLGRALRHLPFAAPLEPAVRRVLESGETLENLHVPSVGTGERSWLEHLHPIRDESGAISGVAVIVEETTARQRAETALREAEAHYRALFESINQGFCILEVLYDTEGHAIDYRFLEVNQNFEAHTGLKDAAGKTALELVPGLERRWIDIYANVAATGERLRFEQGSEMMGRWFEVEAARLGNENSAKVTLLFTDITERNRDRDALFESERRFRQLAETISDVFWITDYPERQLIYVSPSLESVTGMHPRDLRDPPQWRSHIHTDDLERVERAFAEQMLQGQFDEEYRFIRSDGATRWLRDRAFPVTDDTGQVYRVVGVTQDVTQRRLLEDRLRASSDRAGYRLFLSDALRPLTDPEAVKIEATRLLRDRLEAERVFYTEVEADGEHAQIRHIDGNPEPDLRGRYHLEDFGPTIIGELRAGRLVQINNTATDARLNDQERARYRQLGVLAIVSAPLVKSGQLLMTLSAHVSQPRHWTEDDLLAVAETAERTWADVERARLLVLLREVNEAQRRFVGDAAHELRAPLTSIRGNLDLLLRHSQIPEGERLEMLGDAAHEAARLSRLITDLLSVARGDAGQYGDFAPLRFDLILEETVRGARHLTTAHQLIVEISEPVTVIGNRDRLKQLALVLLENAFKYTPAGGTVRARLGADSGWANLTVSDNGPGIAAQDLERVFDRFYRTDRARTPGRDPGGTGLGLTIARQIAERHGGTVWLESQLGAGTTAVVRLPLVQAVAVEPTA